MIKPIVAILLLCVVVGAQEMPIKTQKSGRKTISEKERGKYFGLAIPNADYAYGLEVNITVEDFERYRKMLADPALRHTAEVHIVISDGKNIQSTEMTIEEFCNRVGLKWPEPAKQGIPPENAYVDWVIDERITVADVFDCTPTAIFAALQRAARQLPDPDVRWPGTGQSGTVYITGSGTLTQWPPPDKYADKSYVERLKVIADDKEKEAREARALADKEAARDADIRLVKRLVEQCGTVITGTVPVSKE